MDTRLTISCSGKGLGGNLSIVSALYGIDKPFHIVTTERNIHPLTDIKKIFNIPDEKITMSVGNLDESHVFLEFTKIFANYIPFENLTYYGRKNQHVVKSPGNKPCIGLSCYTHTVSAFDSKQFSNEIEKSTFPYNKLYPIEIYSQIFNLIKLAGYDVITFDSTSIDLENKVAMLNELCDAVIGYEGGIAHLSHALRIPYIMIPWHTRVEQPEWKSFYNTSLETQLMHLDLSTYFLSSVDELLDFTPKELQEKIKELRNYKGNHIVMNQPFKFNRKLTECLVDNQTHELLGIFSNWEKEFLLNHIPDPRISGTHTFQYYE